MVGHVLNDCQLLSCFQQRHFATHKIALVIADFDGNGNDSVCLDSIMCSYSYFSCMAPIADSPLSGIQFRLCFD